MIEFTDTRVANGYVQGLPCAGRISSVFGAVGDARLADGTVLHTQGHTGVDIACATGTEVKAPAPGKVVDVFNLGITSSADWIANWKRVFGNSVILEHAGGYHTLYAHMSEIHVREGMSLTQGALIGKVGSTGLSTGPHLHWGLGGPGNRYVQKDRGILDPLSRIVAKAPPKEKPVALTAAQQERVALIHRTPALSADDIKYLLGQVGLTEMPGEAAESPTTPPAPSTPPASALAAIETELDTASEAIIRARQKLAKLR